MRKFLFFAIALVASVLAFTSCETKIESPLVGGWSNQGEIVVVKPDGTTQTVYGSNSLNFFDNGEYQRNIYIEGTFDGWVQRGEWKVKEDKVTIYTQKSGTINNNNFVYDSSFKPVEEVATWRIENHYLYLTHSDGTVERLYDGSGK